MTIGMQPACNWHFASGSCKSGIRHKSCFTSVQYQAAPHHPMQSSDTSFFSTLLLTIDQAMGTDNMCFS